MVKVVFMGPANSGKTSIKRRFFDGESTSDILSKPAKPTYWEEKNFEHIDFFLRILDLGGQENYVDECHGRLEEMVFSLTDAIVYVVDAADRRMGSKNRSYLQRIMASAMKYYGTTSNVRLYILLHKVDLLPADSQRQQIISLLAKELTKVVELEGDPSVLRNIYETSIYDETSNSTMRIILNELMPAYEKYRQIFKKVIAEDSPPIIERIQLIAPPNGLIVAEAAATGDPPQRSGLISGGVRKADFGALLKSIDLAAKVIDDSGLEYNLMRMKSGRYAIVKNLGRYLLAVESKTNASENLILRASSDLVGLFKEVERLLEKSAIS